MPIEIKTALIGIIAALLGSWAGAAISRRSATDILKKEQFFVAASKFKSTVIYELTGFYPIDQHWEKKEFHRIYNSIPAINSAAAEFRVFASGKADFDKAVSEYNKYCRETTYDNITADTMFPEMRQDGVINKRKQFKNIVDHFLSFAEIK